MDPSIPDRSLTAFSQGRRHRSWAVGIGWSAPVRSQRARAKSS